MNSQILVQVFITIFSILVYMALYSMTKGVIRSFGERQSIAEKRIIYTKKFFQAFFLLFLAVIITIIWGIDFKGIFIFASSFFAIVGIALFASWSILSNITTSIVIFFSFPYKIGDAIRILDGENTVEGFIRDMTFFNIHIECADGNVTFYPNNLAIQKPVTKLKTNKPASLKRGKRGIAE
ncbi:MAG: mechanosensitive ion channel [bacterium]|nr:mechanosensitive ion channel [bacterium]